MPNEQEHVPANTNFPNDTSQGPQNFQPAVQNLPTKYTRAAPSEIEPDTSTFSPANAYEQPAYAANSPVNPSAQPTPVTTPSSDGLSVAPKKSKKGFVVAGVLAVLVFLLVIGGTSAYALWYQNPDRVVGDALGNALMSDSAKTDSVIKATNKQDGSTTNYDIKLKTLNTLKDARADIAVSSDAKEAKFDVSGSVLVKDNEKLFVKIDKLKELLEKSGMQAYLGSSDSVAALIEKLDSNWVVVTKKEVEENTGTKDETSKCIENVTDKLRSDDIYSSELSELYTRYPLITVKQKLGSADGSLGYEIDFARENAIKFTNGLNSTKFYKDIKKCDEKIRDLKGEEIFKESESKDDEKVKVVVWIDRWSHQFTKLEITSTADDATLNLTTSTEFNVPVKIDEPKDAITIDELKSDIEEIQQEMTEASAESSREAMMLNDDRNSGSSSGRI